MSPLLLLSDMQHTDALAVVNLLVEGMAGGDGGRGWRELVAGGDDGSWWREGSILCTNVFCSQLIRQNELC